MYYECQQLSAQGERGSSADRSSYQQEFVVVSACTDQSRVVGGEATTFFSQSQQISLLDSSYTQDTLFRNRACTQVAPSSGPAFTPSSNTLSYWGVMVLGSATAGSLPCVSEAPSQIHHGSGPSTNALLQHDGLQTSEVFQSDVKFGSQPRVSTMSPENGQLEAEARPSYIHVCPGLIRCCL